MRKVVVMSGLSGSGKSTYVQDVLFGRKKEGNVIQWAGNGSCVVLSADDYFIGRDGVYRFDPTKLSSAHGECFRNFISALESECELVVVDNTNTTNEEIAPYMLGAQAYGYDAEIVTLRASVSMCVERNTHGVTQRGIEAQWVRLCSRKLLPWWKNSDIDAVGMARVG